MNKKLLFICLDGCSPEYIEKSPTPNLDRLAKEGFYKEIRAMVPTVTNINNVSLVTGTYPKIHGITANYFLNPKTGKGTYMESADYILTETIFEKGKAVGRSSALLTSKDKLRILLNRGTSISMSVERPLKWIIDKIGPPPSIYSIEADLWLLKAACELLSKKFIDLMYLSTTDYVMHKFKPGDAQSEYYLQEIDRLIGKIVNIDSNIETIITADHGMSNKTKALDLGRILADQEIQCEVIPIIKDRYIIHHQNMGGAAYIYLEKKSDFDQAIAILLHLEGVEEVISRQEASQRYNLFPQRIGDIFVLADKNTVFGRLRKDFEEVNIRSHGSIHEQKIPLIAYGSRFNASQISENKDIAALLIQDFGGRTNEEVN